MTRGIFVSTAVMVVGLALGACAGARRDAAPLPAGAPATMPTAPAVVPTVTPPPAAPASTASALNRSLLTQTTPPAEEGDLPLGPGDLIEVAVFEVPEFDKLKIRIPNGGTITLPLIGAMPAAGLTPSELQSAIRLRLQEKYIHMPQVTLFVHEHKSQRISVMGAVRSGGVFTLTSRLRLADALAMAGGLTEEAGPTVYVIRRVPAQLVAAKTNGGVAGAMEQVMTAIDLQSLVAGKEGLNLPLQSGDVVEVSRAGTYYVGGEVNKPGSFLLKSRTTLDQAPVAAGGVKDAADWDDIRLYRTRPDGTRDVLTFSLNAFEKGQPTPELQANDVVIVGKSSVKAFLYGVRDFFKFGVGATLPVQ